MGGYRVVTVRQLVLVALLLLIGGLVVVPMSVDAAPKPTVVQIADRADSGQVASISSSGALLIHDGAGPLTVDGTVEVTQPVTVNGTVASFAAPNEDASLNNYEIVNAEADASGFFTPNPHASGTQWAITHLTFANISEVGGRARLLVRTTTDDSCDTPEAGDEAAVVTDVAVPAGDTVVQTFPQALVTPLLGFPDDACLNVEALSGAFGVTLEGYEL